MQQDLLAALDKGKPMPTMSGPTHHGGVVYREGCALWPQAQVIGPVPAPSSSTLAGERRWRCSTVRMACLFSSAAGAQGREAESGSMRFTVHGFR